MRRRHDRAQCAAVPGPGLHVADSGGDGRPVVLIHGWPLSGASWSEQITPLRDAGDLDRVLCDLELTDATLVGFSMGGGEVARYVSAYGEDRLHSVVFAAAVPPYLAKSDDNPDGPLDEETAHGFEQGLRDDGDAFFDQLATVLYSAGDELKVSEEQREQALALCRQSDQDAVLGCLEAFGTTDFRQDLTTISVPTLVIQGDADGVVPFEGSGALTHRAVSTSDLHVIEGGPHGINVSHAEEFNRTLLDFLER